MSDIVECILLIVGCLGLLCLVPFISFVEGYVLGWLIKVIFGTTFITGLKLIVLILALTQFRSCVVR